MKSTPLVSEHPTLSAEWDVVANGPIPETMKCGNPAKVSWKCSYGHGWVTSPSARTSKGLTGCPTCSNRRFLPGFNDLATKDPDVASDWHPAKNGNLTPGDVIFNLREDAWWLGSECGHEWFMKIQTRTSAKQGCPVCAGKVIVPGINDLASQFPEVAAMWHTTKNAPLTAQEVTPRSGKKAWWKCQEGHEYLNTISEQTREGRVDLCSVCSGRMVIPGVNDLATVNPLLALEWHPTKNTKPVNTVAVGSPAKVWWVCSKGHEFISPVAYRTRKDGTLSKCGVCDGKQVMSGVTDLGTLRPDIASEWHPTKNGTLTPVDFTVGSSKKVWWQCKLGHEWDAAVKSRTRQDNLATGCPTCSGRRILKGFNDLATVHPDLVEEWHGDKNGKLTPDNFTRSAKATVWWKCPTGHEWEQAIFHRTLRNNGTAWFNCSQCGGSSGEKELQEFVAGLVAEAGLDLLLHDRNVLQPQELDLYIPAKKVAIEYNGIYWHSEAGGKDRNYHHNKWLACKEQGIQLLQIWEDEWVRNPEQVKRMIAHKLGLPYGETSSVAARKTVVGSVKKAEAETFLNEHHIQGYSNGTHYVGLTEPGSPTLLALLVLKSTAGTEGRELDIIRYATSTRVPGGFTKLLKYAERTYKPERFITFSDNCVSDGALYRNNGFVADKELAPDYMYAIRGVRQHKFGYRLKRFRTDPALKWEAGLTERELADLNGLHRIWDAGKTRWIKEVKS